MEEKWLIKADLRGDQMQLATSKNGNLCLRIWVQVFATLTFALVLTFSLFLSLPHSFSLAITLSLSLYLSLSIILSLSRSLFLFLFHLNNLSEKLADVKMKERKDFFVYESVLFRIVP